MALVALLSNPNSTGNRALLPRIRSFCAQHPEVFHYEVEDAGQIGDALASIARVSPKVLILNGGGWHGAGGTHRIASWGPF